MWYEMKQVLPQIVSLDEFTMLKSRRTELSFPLESNFVPYLNGYGRQQKKMYDIELAKAAILEKYQSNVDVFNHRKTHYYVGGVSESVRYRWKRVRRASYSCTRQHMHEVCTSMFQNGVLNSSRMAMSRIRTYQRDLARLAPLKRKITQQGRVDQ